MAVQELGKKGGAGAGAANNENWISERHTVVFSSADEGCSIRLLYKEALALRAFVTAGSS